MRVPPLRERRKLRASAGDFERTFGAAVMRGAPPDQFHGLMHEIRSSRGFATGGAVLDPKG
jgi:hypothetical protein